MAPSIMLLDLLLRLLHQNQDRLSMAKRGQFAELTDAELIRIDSVFIQAFGLGNAQGKSATR